MRVDHRWQVDGPVRYEILDDVVVITINRPDRANSLSQDVRRGLFEVWARFEADGDARVAILTGSGDRSFCSGADLAEMADMRTGEPGPGWAPVLGDSVTVTKPTIAAVNGAAYGGGFLQAQMCDLVIASDRARFGITEARWGRGVPWALPLFSMIPSRFVMELLLTAEPVDASRAAQMGLVNRVVPHDQLMTEAHELAAKVAANAPMSLRACMRMARIARETTDVLQARAMAEEVFAEVYRSEDAQEGPRAFIDGRAPVWKGR
jgi:enoyl-CoA hydratase